MRPMDARRRHYADLCLVRDLHRVDLLSLASLWGKGARRGGGTRDDLCRGVTRSQRGPDMRAPPRLDGAMGLATHAPIRAEDTIATAVLVHGAFFGGGSSNPGGGGLQGSSGPGSTTMSWRAPRSRLDVRGSARSASTPRSAEELADLGVHHVLRAVRKKRPRSCRSGRAPNAPFSSAGAGLPGCGAAKRPCRRALRALCRSW